MSFLCRNPNDVQSHAELLKVDVKVDMQLVVPVDIHPLDKAVYDHLLGLNACGVSHISPRNNIVIVGLTTGRGRRIGRKSFQTCVL